MPWLKVYEWEKQKWPQFHHCALSQHDALKIIIKLSRHFKVSAPFVEFTIPIRSNSSHTGYYQIAREKIRLQAKTNLGTVCHEFAHHLTNRIHWPRVKQQHGPEFKRCLKRVCTWAKRYIPDDLKVVDKSDHNLRLLADHFREQLSVGGTPKETPNELKNSIDK